MHLLFSLPLIFRSSLPFLSGSFLLKNTRHSFIKGCDSVNRRFIECVAVGSAVFGAEPTDWYEACHGWSHLADPEDTTKETSCFIRSSIFTPTLTSCLHQNWFDPWDPKNVQNPLHQKRTKQIWGSLFFFINKKNHIVKKNFHTLKVKARSETSYRVKLLRHWHSFSVRGTLGFCLLFISTVLCVFSPTAKLANSPDSPLLLDWVTTKMCSYLDCSPSGCERHCLSPFDTSAILHCSLCEPEHLNE